MHAKKQGNIICNKEKRSINWSWFRNYKDRRQGHYNSYYYKCIAYAQMKETLKTLSREEKNIKKTKIKFLKKYYSVHNFKNALDGTNSWLDTLMGKKG